MMKFKESIVKIFVLTSIAELFGFVSNFLILYLLTFIYHPSEFVYYPFSLAFYSFFSIFANFGLGTTMIRYLSTLRNKHSEENIKLISEGFKWIFIFSSIVSLTLFFTSNIFEQIYEMTSLSLTLRYTSLYLFFSNFISYIESTFQGLMKYKLYAISNITLNSLKLLCILSNLSVKIPIYVIIRLFSIVALIQFIVILLLIQMRYKYLSFNFSFDREKKNIKIS